MWITTTEYFELPVSLDHAVAAAQQFIALSTRSIGAERYGELWRWGNELYYVRKRGTSLLNEASPLDEQRCFILSWEVTPVVLQTICLDIDLILYDAIISTHTQIRVTLTRSGIDWPWQRILARRRLTLALRSCCAEFQALLQEQAAQTQSPALTAIDTVPITTQAPVQCSETTAQSTPWARQPLAKNSSPTLAERLRPHYPRTIAQFEAMHALDQLERISQLEHGWAQILRGFYAENCYVCVDEPTPSARNSQSTSIATAPKQDFDYDLICAGGSLSLFHAVVMAQCYGWRVMVFDRDEVGRAHREWNISRAELQVLVDLGIVSWAELSLVMMREYHNSLIRFFSSPNAAEPVSSTDLYLPNVLNIALDADTLLQLMRRKLEESGGTVLSRRRFRRVQVNSSGALRVCVELENEHSTDSATVIEIYSARLLLDGMGSVSPLALRRHKGRPFAGVCPTVGTVATGFIADNAPREHDRICGDILISVTDSQHGKQLLWEGFPGRGNAVTIYLFYYATLNKAALGNTNIHSANSEAPELALFELFEHYFALLPSYKQPGPDFRHIKPVYGYIPARHSLRHQEAPLLRGVLPIGDSAAQQSPLTFCGFGSYVRNLQRSVSLLDYALRHNLTAPEHLHHINAFQANVSLNWVFSRFMQPWNQPSDVNILQNVFLAVLNDCGVDFATRFFQDRMRWSDYLPILLRVFWRYPQIVFIAWRVLGPNGVRQWIGDYFRFSRVAVYATLGRIGGKHGERALIRLADRIDPALGLRLRASYAEWRAMGWF